MEAAILAGGLGKRFRPYTEIIPKPMIPIGDSEKPLLEFIISWLRREGVRRFVLLVGYRWRYIYNYFGDGDRLGVEIRYSVDDYKYSGTGGALLKAVETGALRSSHFIVWYGDILAEVPVASVVKAHLERGSHATLVTAESYQVPVGLVHESQGRVVKVEEKPWLPVKVFVGVAVLSREPLIKASEELGTAFDVMSDLIPWLIENGYTVTSFRYTGAWYDVGSLERYEKLDKSFVARLEKLLGFV